MAGLLLFKVDSGCVQSRSARRAFYIRKLISHDWSDVIVAYSVHAVQTVVGLSNKINDGSSKI